MNGESIQVGNISEMFNTKKCNLQSTFKYSSDEFFVNFSNRYISENFFKNGEDLESENLSNEDSFLSMKRNNSDNIKFRTKHSDKFNVGRWSDNEHKKFLEAILKYGNEWKKVQNFILTRSSTQARSHAQKFFLRLKKYIFSSANEDSSINDDFILESFKDNKGKI
jgi:SHAQKYF class myb-like DNA-binding protein